MDNLFYMATLVAIACYVIYVVGVLVANRLFGDLATNLSARTVFVLFGLLVTGAKSVIAIGLHQGTMVALVGWLLFFAAHTSVRIMRKSL